MSIQMHKKVIYKNIFLGLLNIFFLYTYTPGRLNGFTLIQYPDIVAIFDICELLKYEKQ